MRRGRLLHQNSEREARAAAGLYRGIAEEFIDDRGVNAPSPRRQGEVIGRAVDILWGSQPVVITFADFCKEVLATIRRKNGRWAFVTPTKERKRVIQFRGSGPLRSLPVVPAKAGTQGFQSLALGPRLRGDDAFVWPLGFSDRLFRGGESFLPRKVASRMTTAACWGWLWWERI